jgi:hypothetical protein
LIAYHWCAGIKVSGGHRD